MYKATNIKWETDGCEVDLPSEINIPKDSLIKTEWMKRQYQIGYLIHLNICMMVLKL